MSFSEERLNVSCSHCVRPYGFGGYVYLARPCKRTVCRLYLLEKRTVAKRLITSITHVGGKVENAARAVCKSHVYVESIASPCLYGMLKRLHGRLLLVKSANLCRVKVAHH